jgi:orotate phosphoribosyltransferase
LVVRPDAKDHGLGKQIEVAKGINWRNVTIIEDVITSGSSIVRTAKILEDAGYVVEQIFVVLDREERKIPELAKYRWRALMTLSELMDWGPKE